MHGLSSLGASGQLQASMTAFDRSANALSSATAQASAQASNDVPDSATSGPDMIDAMVSLRVSASDVKANIAVVRAADEMLGTLLDVRA